MGKYKFNPLVRYKFDQVGSNGDGGGGGNTTPQQQLEAGISMEIAGTKLNFRFDPDFFKVDSLNRLTLNVSNDLDTCSCADLLEILKKIQKQVNEIQKTLNPEIEEYWLYWEDLEINYDNPIQPYWEDLSNNYEDPNQPYWANN